MSRKPYGKCAYPGCDFDAHARGLCRHHYGMAWRKDKCNQKYIKAQGVEHNRYDSKDGQPTANLFLQWHRLMRMYVNMFSIVGRIKLRREIKEVETGMMRAGVEIPKEVEDVESECD